ncbi:MAG: hypothetical protein OXC11_11600 [Rhodospirillales bacterium]|nr:hypothetical protein [Rhodospirillales bacterium]
MSGDGPRVDLASPSCATADSSGRGPAAAQSRVVTMLRETVLELDSLPASLCPNDEAVVSFWFREGRHPQDLLRAMSRIAPIRVVGSRLGAAKRAGSSEGPTEWFAAASRRSFPLLLAGVAAWRPSRWRAELLGAVAHITPPVPEERVRFRWTGPEKQSLEVVLHAGDGAEDRHIVEGFRRYLRKLDLRPYRDRVLFAGRLAFLGLTATAEEALEVARFSFVRTVREMPRLRLRRPTPPSLGYLQSVSSFGVLSPPFPNRRCRAAPTPTSAHSD